MVQAQTKINIGDRFKNCEVVDFDCKIEKVNGVEKRKQICICLCDCGAEFSAFKYRLRNGRTTSCGACKRKINGALKVKDLTGQTFTYLTVIRRIGSTPEGKAYWLCECKCGNQITTQGKLLRNGDTKSCGCFSRENAKKRRVRLEGKKLGLLTIQEFLGEEYYDCSCQCGKKVKRKQQVLVEAKTTLHCGSAICSADPKFIGPVLSFADARILGLKFYSDGKPCQRNHIALKLVSTMSCLLCHKSRTKAYAKANPKKIKSYSKNYLSNEEGKETRNKQLKGRRDADPIYRYTELLRTRLSKVLRKLQVTKPKISNRSKFNQENIEKALQRQGLDALEITSGNYELDHIKPLATFPWSLSETANRLVEQQVNCSKNLQFLTQEDHKIKTQLDWVKHGWLTSEVNYKDHTLDLIDKITNNLDFPEYFSGNEKKILNELLAAELSHQSQKK